MGLELKEWNKASDGGLTRSILFLLSGFMFLNPCMLPELVDADL